MKKEAILNFDLVFANALHIGTEEDIMCKCSSISA